MPDVSRLREQLLALADGEEPEDTLGPPPWTVEQAAPWEARHGHDVRLGCLSVDSCAVVEELHEAAVNALPKLLECVDLLAKHEWSVGWPQYEKVCPECFGFAADSPHFGGEKEYGPPGHKPGCALRAALASLETDT